MPDPQEKFPELLSVSGISSKFSELMAGAGNVGTRISAGIGGSLQMGETPSALPLGTTDRDATAEAGGLVADEQGALNSKNNEFQVYRYPVEVGNEENPHYVMFFVNIPETRIKQSGGAGNVRAYYDPTKNNPGGRMNLNENDGTMVRASAATGLIAGASKAADGMQSVAKAEFGRAAGNFVGAAALGTLGVGAGMAVGAIANQAMLHSRHVQLKECIALHIQSKPGVEYTAQWTDQEMGMMGALNKNKSIGDMAKYIVREAALKASMLPKLVGIGYDFRSYTEKAEQRVPNPHKEQLFRSMGMRKFSFEYTFMPKSRDEYVQVKAIIKAFKKYMHPVIDPSKYFLVYPAEFNIIYYYGDNENPHMHKITSCALTDMKLDYGGADFMSFRDTEGAPAELFMSLTFTEMEMLTAERIEQGF